MKNIYTLLIPVIFSLTCSNSFAIKDGQDVAKLHLKPKGVAAISGVDPSGNQLSLCSGIFISDHLMLTAKHCVQDGLPMLTIIDAKTIKQFITAPASDIRASAILDLAIISFPDNTAKNFTSITNLNQNTGDSFEIRGFGAAEDPDFSMLPLPSPGKAEELTAKFELTSATSNELIFRLHPTGSFAVDGDSGSPLFNKNGELAAIMITFEHLDSNDEYGNEWMQNTAVSLTSNDAKSFVQKAIADLQSAH